MEQKIKNKQEIIGPLMASIIIILLLLIGGYYYFKDFKKINDVVIEENDVEIIKIEKQEFYTIEKKSVEEIDRAEKEIELLQKDLELELQNI